MQVLVDMMRFSIAPTPIREASVGVVAVAASVLLPLLLGASPSVRIVVPVVVAIVYAARFGVAVQRSARRDRRR